MPKWIIQKTSTDQQGVTGPQKINMFPRIIKKYQNKNFVKKNKPRIFWWFRCQMSMSNRFQEVKSKK